MNTLWKKTKIGLLCKRVTSGGTPKSTQQEYYDNGNIPWLNSKEVNFSRIYSTEKCITEKGLAESSAKWIEKNSVIVAMYGATAGQVAITKIALTTNQACCNLTINEELADYRYIYYYLSNQYHVLAGLANGGAQQNLNAQIIKDIEIYLPDLNVQKNISDILSSLDEQIENNNTINHNLEEQAKAVFTDYFPYSIEDDLPAGWRKGCLGEIIELHDSKRIPLSGNERAKMEKIYPYYGAASLMDYVNDYLFDGIFLLLGEDGTVITDDGFPILQYVWGKFWVNNHAHILTGKSGFSVESLFLLLKQTAVKSIVTGAVQPKISQMNLKSIQIVIPPENLLHKFNGIIAPLFALIRQNSEENNRLAQLRDALLPKLMSGEIDVSEVEV